MIQVTPSILSKNPDEVASQIERLLPFFSHFQIDFADGNFVDNTLCSPSEVAQVLLYKNLIPQINLDFHLMVENPTEWILEIQKEFSQFNIDRILIHINTFEPSEFQQIQKSTVSQIGVVLNPENSVDVLINAFPNLNTIPFVQLMTVIPGMQGNPFIPEACQKIEQLRKAEYKGKILLDGGINKETITYIQSLKYQPDIIAPGSYLSKSENLEKTVKELSEQLQIHS